MKIFVPIVLGLALFLGGCCHLDRRSERLEPIEKVALGISGPDEVSLHFTRKRSRTTRLMAGPLTRTGASSERFDDLLKSLRQPMLLRSLQRSMSLTLSQMLGWKIEDSKLEFALEVEELVLTASGPLTPATAIWVVSASLTDLEADMIIWRECANYEIGLRGVSLNGLTRMQPEQFIGFLRELTSDLAEEIVQKYGAGKSADKKGTP